MKKTKNLLKYAIPALALAMVTFSACDKEPATQTITPVYRAPYAKQLSFNHRNVDSVKVPVVKKYVDDTACKRIYLSAADDNNFTSYTSDDIHTILIPFLNERIELSDKVTGDGDFWFKKGMASLPDSIWFVTNGWTVNQRRH